MKEKHNWPLNFLVKKSKFQKWNKKTVEADQDEIHSVNSSYNKDIDATVIT